jgi:hypothetical protein
MRLRNKLGGLAFLDGAILPMVSTIDDLVRRMPPEGLIEGAFYHELVATVLLLGDPAKMRTHAAARSSVTGFGSTFFAAAAGGDNEDRVPADAGEEAAGQSPGGDLFDGLFQEPAEMPSTPHAETSADEAPTVAPGPAPAVEDVPQPAPAAPEMPVAAEPEPESEVLEDPALDDDIAEPSSDPDSDPVLMPPCESGRIVQNFFF